MVFLGNRRWSFRCRRPADHDDVESVCDATRTSYPPERRSLDSSGVDLAFDELKQSVRDIEFLSDPRAQSVHLKGLAPSPGAVGHLLWNPESRKGILITQGLPKNTPDKVYELWAIAGDEPVPMGTFSVEDKPHTLLKIPSLPQGKSFDKFAVTLEPAGGVPRPTGPMHLLGSV